MWCVPFVSFKIVGYPISKEKLKDAVFNNSSKIADILHLSSQMRFPETRYKNQKS